MKVILLKEVHGRGGEGDVIEVKRGFANNYLLTQGYAVKATPGNLKQLEQRRKNIEKREEGRVADAEALAEKLNGAKVHVEAQVGEEGQLFGSVTTPMIADAIKNELDVDIDRRRVELGKPIKVVGEYEVPVSIYRTIKATVNVVVKGVTADGEEVEVETAEPEVEGEETIVATDGAEVEVDLTDAPAETETVETETEGVVEGEETVVASDGAEVEVEAVETEE